MVQTTTQILLHLTLLLFIPATSNSVSDNDTMYNILISLTPTPFGWSSATTYCSWQGIKCDAQNKVVSIDLASQSLSGTLSTSFNSLTRLTTLCIQHNNLSGDFPSLAKLFRLRKLYLHNNSFTSITKGAFLGLISLRVVNLSNNTNLIPWTFPSDLASSHKLSAIYASYANLIGTIPDIFWSFPELVNLTLSFNNLTGSLPSSFNGSMIQTLKVDNQMLGLTGNIDLLTGMNKLSIVWIQGNRFTGIIPSSFVSLPYLSEVRLENNQFQVSIPHFPKNVRVSLGTIMPKNYSKRNDNDNWLFNCRSCKVYIRTVNGSGGGGGVPVAPQETPSSSGKKANVGAVVGYSILLVVILVLFAVCLWVTRSRGRRRTYNQQLTVQMAIPREENLPKQRVEELVIKEVKLPVRKEQGDKKQVQQEGGREGKEPGNKERRDDKKQVKQEGGREGIRRGREEEVKRRSEKEEPAVKEENDEPRLQKYSFNDIKIMTKNFDQRYVLGEGAFALVYKGSLFNGVTVAIKRIKLKQQGRDVNDFKNEVDALGGTFHFNLVKLIGYCVEGEHKILVYEYMCNGSLEDWIFGKYPAKFLSWREMKKVILGITKGLGYLHEDCHKKILHRDLKPANILLDEKKNAKLADFGISKLLERDQSSTSTVGMGTPAYVAPEVFNFEKISVKVDVYSFGIVVLEIMFGKHYGELVGSNRTHLQLSQLPGLIKNLSDEMRKNGKQVETIGKLAISCLSARPEDRPTMSDILSVVKSLDIEVRRN